MAYQIGKQSQKAAITQKAKGDAPNTGSPGPTPAPSKTYVNPVLVERQLTPGYGNARDFLPSSIEPGTTVMSPLAAELKRVGALGDQGDHLQDIIDHGTARNGGVDLQSPQLRKIDASPITPSWGNSGASRGPMIPGKLGQVETPNPVDPYAKNKK